jgi:hypothetical protein
MYGCRSVIWYRRPVTTQVITCQLASSHGRSSEEASSPVSVGVRHVQDPDRRCARRGERTVKTHVARIVTKLDLRDRAQAVVAAFWTFVSSFHAALPRRARVM